MTDQQRALNYMNYLAVDELLSLQRPVSDGPEHDELLFITIHQVYELWFKQLLHEIEQAQREMDAVRTQDVLATLNRVKVILAVCIRQVDVLVTMTHRAKVEARMSAPSLWDSALAYLNACEFSIPQEILDRDVAQPYEPDDRVTAAVLEAYRSGHQAALVCEQLVDIEVS
ncbi:MAG: tryptophan 2,3-dioxygenase family protein, partial [Actinomycetota bacterium]